MLGNKGGEIVPRYNVYTNPPKNNAGMLAVTHNPSMARIDTNIKTMNIDGSASLFYKVAVAWDDTLSLQRKIVSGYVKKSDFDQMSVSTVPIPANFAGLEAEMVPTRLENQLFRIYEVTEDEDCVTIVARHVWYDNLQNYTLWKPDAETAYTGASVCRNILGNAVSPVFSDVASDCTDTKNGDELDYERKNLVEAFLDPEKGVCAKFGLSLIRNNWDFYCLKEVGYDRGFVIQNGKNLLGVERVESIENTVTRVVPFAKKGKDIVWYNQNGVKWVDSPHIGDYSHPRVEILDTGITVGKDGVTDQNVQQKLQEAAQKRFTDDKADIPEVEMTIEFLSLGDTEEYAQYRGLDKVYLYDIVTIKDTVRDYEYSAQVVGVEHDILTGMLTSVTLGKLQNSDGVRKIAVWQVPEVSGENIRLLSIQAGSFAEGAIFGSDIAEHVIEYVHIASATIDSLNADAITAITAQIENIIAGHITADSIKTSAIDAINAKLGIASIADAEIANASIGFAQIKTATAESLIARDAVTDRYFIDKLQVRNVQAVQATVGDLVVKASNGYYYRLDVGTDGSLAPTRVYPTSSAIAEGRMGNGAIIETDLTVAELSASNMKAINALIDKLTASRIDVDELFARSAFINKLNTTDISSNTYLQLMVNSKNKTYRQWATPSDPHEGDTWYKQGPQPISEMQGYTHAQLAQFPYWAFNGYQLYIYENGSWRKVEDEAEIRSTIAQILLQNDSIDLMVAQLDTEMDNKYTVRSGIAIELAGIEVSGSKYVRIKSGGKFVVDSGNFSIDENGNVRMTGTVYATDGSFTGTINATDGSFTGSITSTNGSIGGFALAANRLSSGSGTSFVALDSGTDDYAMWVGNGTASSAPFRLKRTGALALTKLEILGENGTATEVNLRNYALWKLNYQAIKSWTVENGAVSIVTTNGTISFDSAASVAFSDTGSWSNGSRTLTLTNGKTTTVSMPIQSDWDWGNSIVTVTAGGRQYHGTVDGKYYNNGWNACRDAMVLTERYTRSAGAWGGSTTHYIKTSSGTYSSVGSNWYTTTRADLYTKPSARS